MTLEKDIVSEVKNGFPLTGRRRLITTIDGSNIEEVIEDISKQQSYRNYNKLCCC